MEKQVLVVRLPDKAEATCREMRDYIVESIQLGVLVVTQGVTYRVETMPDLGGVLVFGGSASAGKTDSWSTFHLPPDPEPVPDSDTAQEPDLGEEKRRIRDRLQRYRDANGLGCLEAVAKKTRTKGRINSGVLRDLLIGAAALPIADWRKIDLALNSLGWEVEGQRRIDPVPDACAEGAEK